MKNSPVLSGLPVFSELRFALRDILLHDSLDQDFLHRYVQQISQRQQIVRAGDRFPALPAVNGLRRLKPEVRLKIRHGQPVQRITDCR